MNTTAPLASDEPLRRPDSPAPFGLAAASVPASAVELILGSAVDYAGVARAKVVPLERIDAFTGSGVGASPTWPVFCIDQGIAFTEGIGVTGDLRLRLDEAAARRLDDGLIWGPVDFITQDGKPFAGCPRTRLKSIVADLASIGISVRTGAELEFTVKPIDGISVAPWQGYGLRTAAELGPFFRDVVASMRTAGIEPEQLHAEYGDGQVEIALPPADALTSADRVILVRALVGRAAARHGLAPSFSPLPFPNSAGNGAHLHLSMCHGAAPLFAGGDGPHGITRTGGAAIAGIVAGLLDVQAILAGTLLSPLRLRPGMYSGAWCCWGLENREAAVRFIRGDLHSSNVEVKAADPSANPYLVSAAILGLALHGIQNNLQIPAEVSEHSDDLLAARPDVAVFEQDHQTAVDRLENSALAHQILGSHIVAGSVAVRRYEHDRLVDQELSELTAAYRYAFNC